MTNRQWYEICKEIVPHLQAIYQIAKDNEICRLNMRAGSEWIPGVFCIIDGTVFSCDKNWDGGYGVSTDAEEYIGTVEDPTDGGPRSPET